MPTPRCAVQFQLIPWLLLGVGLATTAPRAVAAPLFAAPFLSFDTGADPSSVAIGDFNADGKPDIVVANSYYNTVSALLGNGNGTFGTKSAYGSGSGPPSPVIGV